MQNHQIKGKPMTLFSTIVEKVRGLFSSPKTTAEPASSTPPMPLPNPEPIQPIVVTPAGNPVPPMVPKQEPIVESVAAAAKEAPMLAQPSPAKVPINQEPLAAKNVKAIKKPRVKKEAKKEEAKKEETPKKEKKSTKKS